MLRMCALTVFGETDSCPAISGTRLYLDHASSAPRSEAEVVGGALVICRGELAGAPLWLPARPPLRSAYAGRSVRPDGRREPRAVWSLRVSQKKQLAVEVGIADLDHSAYRHDPPRCLL